MNLLILTNDEDEAAGFEDHFEDPDVRSLADVGIKTGSPATVKVDGTPLTEYDAIYLDPEPKASIYARVLLETIQENRIPCNLNPTAFFIMAKKHYLFKVLEEREIDIPPTVAISTEKGLSAIEDDIEFPAVAKMYEGFKRDDITRVKNHDELKTFAEHAEHGKNVIIVQELIEGDLFDALYVDGEVIALKMDREDWPSSRGNNPRYHNLSSEQEDTLEAAARFIGTDVCRFTMMGNNIIDVRSQPDLHHFQEESGKNVYGRVASVLEGDDE